MSTACARLPLCCCRRHQALLPTAWSRLSQLNTVLQLVHRTNPVVAWQSHRCFVAWRDRQPHHRSARVGVGIGQEHQSDNSPAVASQAPAPQQKPEAVSVYFGSDGVYTVAQPGDNLWAVASKASVVIPTSCNSGSCGTCEMEVRKWDEAGVEGGTSIARTCIAAVPPGYTRLQLDVLDDGIWGADGFDT